MQPALVKRMASVARSSSKSRNIASGSRTPTRTPAKTTSRTERSAVKTPAEALAKTPATTPTSTLKGPIYRLPAEKLLLYADRGLIVVNKPNGLISQLSDPYDTETVRFSPASARFGLMPMVLLVGAERRRGYLLDVPRGYVRAFAVRATKK